MLEMSRKTGSNERRPQKRHMWTIVLLGSSGTVISEQFSDYRMLCTNHTLWALCD